MLIRQLAFCAIGFALSFSQLGYGEAVLDGIFQGTMELNSRDGSTYSVPLAVALTPTGETKAIPNGSGIFEEEQVIDGAFLIDEEGLVRHQVINDLPLGRNVDEMLRMVDALAFHQDHGEVCPAGWTQGKAGMDASPEGVAKYLAAEADKL